MPHGCGACLAIIIILLIILAVVGVGLYITHPDIAIKIREIWSLLGQIWAIIRG